MHLRHWLFLVICGGVAAATFVKAGQSDPGRQVLLADDGFASLGEGTIGGASADAAHVFVVRTRAELLAAINAGPTGAPRIINVNGVIDANVDDSNRPLTCTDYYRDGDTREAFLAFYNPAGPWGPNPPANTAGSLEA